MVGMVVTTSPSFNLYKIVVFPNLGWIHQKGKRRRIHIPAASRPTINILNSFFPNHNLPITIFLKNPLSSSDNLERKAVKLENPPWVSATFPLRYSANNFFQVDCPDATSPSIPSNSFGPANIPHWRMNRFRQSSPSSDIILNTENEKDKD